MSHFACGHVLKYKVLEKAICIFLNDDEYVGTFEYFRKTQNRTRGKAGDKKFSIVVKWHTYNTNKIDLLVKKFATNITLVEVMSSLFVADTFTSYTS